MSGDMTGEVPGLANEELDSLLAELEDMSDRSDWPDRTGRRGTGAQRVLTQQTVLGTGLPAPTPSIRGQNFTVDRCVRHNQPSGPVYELHLRLLPPHSRKDREKEELVVFVSHKALRSRYGFQTAILRDCGFLPILLPRYRGPAGYAAWVDGLLPIAHDAEDDAGHVLMSAIKELVTESAGLWSGTATKLLERINHKIDSPLEGCPSSPHTLGRFLRKLTPQLWAAGVSVNFRRANGWRRDRIVLLTALGRDSIRNRDGRAAEVHGLGDASGFKATLEAEVDSNPAAEHSGAQNGSGQA